MAKGTELAVINDPEYAILKAGGFDAIKTALAENCPTGVDEFDMDRVTMPASGGEFWSVPTLAGVSPESTITGVIVCQGERRAYWSESYAATGGGTPPDCASMDTIHGEGDPGGECARCPYAQFGSAPPREDGTESRGQACNHRKLLLVMRETGILPLLVSCAPTSLKPLKKYLLRLAGEGRPMFSVVTELGLEVHSDPVPHSVVVPKCVGLLDEETTAKFAKISDGLKGPFSMAGIRVEDVATQ